MPIAALLLTFPLLVSCVPGPAGAPAATAAEAAGFLARADARLLELGTAVARSGWAQQNFATQYTEPLNARRTGREVPRAREHALLALPGPRPVPSDPPAARGNSRG
jgi:hypothetical protein